MPLELEIIRAAEFIRLGPKGHFDLPASKAALATLAAACRKRAINSAILDLRALQPRPKPVFSPADLLELINTFPAVGFSKDLRLAVLYTEDPHRRARLFALLSTLRGWEVQAFADFEQALSWLSSPVDATADQELAHGAAVPVQKAAKQAKSPPGPKRLAASSPRRGVKSGNGRAALPKPVRSSHSDT